MNPRSLGSSDLRVSPIGLGCWQFSRGVGAGGTYWPTLPLETIRGIIRASLEGGVNWFDTAESYGWGESERTLSSMLREAGKTSADVHVATKWWPVLRKADSIFRTMDTRLSCLKGFRIDLYQVHQPLGLSSTEREMAAMAMLIKAKKIRYVGVSNFNARQMRRADAELRRHGLRLVANQIRYSLLHRSMESNGVLETAKELDISIIAYSPLAQGVLSGRYHSDTNTRPRPVGVRKYLPDFSRRTLDRIRPLIAVLRGVSENRGVTLAQIALNWVISFHGEMVVAIPGATSVEHAREDAASMNVELSPDELAGIDEASKACGAK